MKYASFVMALLLSFAITLPLSANDLPENPDITLRVEKSKEKVVDVRLLNLQQKLTYISITTLNGADTFFRESVNNHNGYTKRFDLSDLLPGKYILTVKQGDKKIRQVIVIDAEQGMMLSNIVG